MIFDATIHNESIISQKNNHNRYLIYDIMMIDERIVVVKMIAMELLEYEINQGGIDFI